MRCRKVQKLLSDYLEGKLDEELAAGVAQHIESCAQCSSDLAVERAILRSIEAYPVLDVPEGFADEVIELFYARESLAQEQLLRLSQLESWSKLMSPTAAGRIDSLGRLLAMGDILRVIAEHTAAKVKGSIACTWAEVGGHLRLTGYSVRRPLTLVGQRLGTNIKSGLVPLRQL